MKIDDIYRFGDAKHYSGFVVFNDLSISLLEDEIKQIRTAFEIIEKQQV